MKVKTTRNGMRMEEECVQYLNLNLLSGCRGVCERWKIYFHGLLNDNMSGRAEAKGPNTIIIIFSKANTDIS